MTSRPRAAPLATQASTSEREFTQPGADGAAAALERACGVDPHKPLVSQVGRLGARYREWLEHPNLSTAPLLMFENPFLEMCSKTPWWTVPLLWLPLVVSSLCTALWQHGLAPAALVCWLALGLLAWTVLEYVLHRFVFHAQPLRGWAVTLHFALHGCHHKQPADRLRLVFPPLFAAPLVAFFGRACRTAVGGAPGLVMWSGMLLGYINYDVGHYHMHSGARCGWLAGARRRHLRHHFKETDRNYGVSCDLLDRLCGTRQRH